MSLKLVESEIDEPQLKVLLDVKFERDKQDSKWGQQDHRLGCGANIFKSMANEAKRHCDQQFKKGQGTWRHILIEEVYEALAESDPNKIREELIQVAAVVVAMVECLDRQTVSKLHTSTSNSDSVTLPATV